MTPDLDRLRIQRPEGDLPRSGGRLKVVLALAAVLLLVLAGLYFWGPLQPSQEVSVASASRIFPYQAYTVLNASGYVVAQRKAAVSSKSTGRLIFLGVEEGSRVRKGQVLASLENDDLIATKNQAAAQVKEAEAGLAGGQAELADARLQYQRFKTLVGQDLVSKQDYDAAVARYRKALAGVDSARARIRANRMALAGAAASLEYSYIRSPFDGVVTVKYADVGEIVAPFGAAANARAAVVTLADLDSLMVEADVAESNLGIIRRGQPCEISLDAIPNQRFAGEVHMIVPTADRTKATVLTKVKFMERDDRILPEMSARVAFLSRPLDPGEREPRLTVPKRAVVTKNGRTFVFRLDRHQVRLAPVTVAADLGEQSEISAGLQEGDRVVLAPPDHLKDGSRVKVKE
ncbi:MAG: efflux RND transporter periplasmic adaptor subunit [Deltaproteobacteria bacterium]|nr:efflux RND transporter periplasmic adaptor subunit [Deltaproteobacteria bacterium]